MNTTARPIYKRIPLGLRILAAAIIVVASVLAVVWGANRSGYCFAKKRFFGDDEFTVAAIAYELKYHEDKGDVMYKPKRYASLEEFRRHNPKCCSITRDVFDDLPIIGPYIVSITIWYQISDADADNYYEADMWLDQCMSPIRRWSRSIPRPDAAADQGGG